MDNGEKISKFGPLFVTTVLYPLPFHSYKAPL